MKKNLFIVFVLLFGLLTFVQAQVKRYEVKSGKIVYKTNGSGKVLGMFDASIKGEEKLVFKDWGNVELRNKKEKQTGMENTNTHYILKFDNNVSYYVDFENKSIYKSKDNLINPDEDLQTKGKEMMKSMGGKKIGTGKVLGYTCEIWEAMGIKIWIYKGILLKSASNILGMKSTTEAVEAKFNISIPKKEFTLPNFPILENEDLRQRQIQGQIQNNSNKTKQNHETKDLNKLMEGVNQLFGN